jgi:hypothetical protein
MSRQAILSLIAAGECMQQGGAIGSELQKRGVPLSQGCSNAGKSAAR